MTTPTTVGMMLNEALREMLRAAQERGIMTPYDVESFTLGRMRNGDSCAVSIGHDDACPALDTRDIATCQCAPNALLITNQGIAWAYEGQRWFLLGELAFPEAGR